MTINPKFKIGDMVYLKTDCQQQKRIIQYYHVFESEIIYQVGCGLDSSEHHWFELNANIDLSISLGLDDRGSYQN